MNTLLKRFWSKVDKKGPIPEHMPHLGKCWMWKGAKAGNGYGGFRVGDSNTTAHRWIYGKLFSEVPAGKDCCHHCDNRKCVRPSHLFVGSRSDNMFDCSSKSRLNNSNARLKKCVRGHDLSRENVWVYLRDGKERRVCKKCNLIRNRKFSRFQTLKQQQPK